MSVTLRLLLGCAALAAASPLPAQRRLPAPAEVLGFEPGAERRLAEWDAIVRYFRILDAASPRVVVRELGRSTQGRPFIAAFISSPAHLARLGELRALQGRLADPRTVPDSMAAQQLLARGRTVVLITAGVHSTEVGGPLTVMVLADRLARAPTPALRAALDQTVVILVPALNPDGVDLVARWYAQTLDTPAEGSDPPELYHTYAGHDTNRDWYAFTQIETRLVVDSIYGIWHPHVTMDIHQQSPFGSRIFVPPYLDPVEPNVEPLVVQAVNALGTEIARRLTTAGFRGVAVHAGYDAWSPARAFQHYRGAARILTETARADLATAITVSPDSFAARRGLNPRVRSWNFVEPWPGGTWRLEDIVRYQHAAALALVEHVGRTAREWRHTSFAALRRAAHGWEGWPYAFVIPTAHQNQTGLAVLLDILRRAQVEVRQALQPFVLAGERFSPGTYVVVLRQPFAAFAKAVLERQQYPDRREFPGGPPEQPYDVTAHTLPLLLGVRVLAAADSLPTALSAPAAVPEPMLRARGLVNGTGRTVTRVGLYRSWVPAIDEGWTRWVFDTWGVPYESVSDSMMRAGNLAAQFDAIILPSQPSRDMVLGLPARRYPPRYTGGLGQAGIHALRDFVDAGGTVIAFNEASRFAIGALELPVADALAAASTREVFAPGAIFRLELDTSHPLAAGMSAQSVAWFESGPVFEIRDPTRARVVARYPEAAGEVLLSGYLLGADRIAGGAALVEARRGRGRVVLFGFRPPYRGQSLATFPLVFNAIRTSAR